MMPLYEAKMLHQFDHRWATFDGLATRDVTTAEKTNPNFVVLPRYWVTESEVEKALKNRWDRPWLVGYRWIARTTDERTLIASPTARTAAGNSEPLLVGDGAGQIAAIFCSLVLDYVARQKLGGANMTFGTVQQLAVLPPEAFVVMAPWANCSVQDWLGTRLVELSFTAWDMAPFAADQDDRGSPFVWDDERRAVLRAELDAAFFRLYSVERDDVEYILDTFPILRRKDEARFGEFRTRRLILENYDALANASESGAPFVSRLDPPPGQGRRHPVKEVVR